MAADAPRAVRADDEEREAAAAPTPPVQQQQQQQHRPRVGMGVIVTREDGKICLGQRINSLGHGEWALPGGHLEHGEALDACAIREVAEETGILLPSARLVAVENVLFNGGAGPHYLVLFMLGRAPPGAEPRVLEPTKCAAWTWVGLDELGSAPYAPLFQPLQQLLDRGWRPNQANAEL